MTELKITDWTGIRRPDADGFGLAPMKIEGGMSGPQPFPIDDENAFRSDMMLISEGKLYRVISADTARREAEPVKHRNLDLPDGPYYRKSRKEQASAFRRWRKLANKLRPWHNGNNGW